MLNLQNFPLVETKLIAISESTFSTEKPVVISCKTSEFRPVVFTGKNGEQKVNYRHRNASTESKRTATENFLSIVNPLSSYFSVLVDGAQNFILNFTAIENFALGETFTIIAQEADSEYGIENISVDVIVNDCENGKFKYSFKVYSPVEKIEKSVFTIDEEEALELQNLIITHCIS